MLTLACYGISRYSRANERHTVITPGAIDLHTHLREPGDNTSETIESGTRAALLGGFVMVTDMPNNPGKPVWNKHRLDRKIQIAEETAWIPTGFYAGSQPESDNVGNLENMAPHAVGLKLYGDPTTGNVNTYDAEDFRDIVTEWHRLAPMKPIMFHAGEHNLEDMITLVHYELKHPLHVCHVNDPDQVIKILSYQDDDKMLTCGICPHHLLKTSHDVHTQGTFAEMKPPLAKQGDAEELMWMLDQGMVDVIETDFAPHSIQSKYQAEHTGGHCYGVPGIEHVMPLMFYQAHKKRLSMERLIEATFTRPSEILGVRFDRTTKVTWEMEGAYRISEDDIEANCGWTPYIGMLAIGKVDSVKIGGTPVVSAGKVLRKHPEIVEKRGHMIT